MVDVWILFELVSLETVRVYPPKIIVPKGFVMLSGVFVVLLPASRVWSNPVGSHDTT